MGDKTTRHQFPSVENHSKYALFKHQGIGDYVSFQLKTVELLCITAKKLP